MTLELLSLIFLIFVGGFAAFFVAANVLLLFNIAVLMGGCVNLHKFVWSGYADSLLDDECFSRAKPSFLSTRQRFARFVTIFWVVTYLMIISYLASIFTMLASY